MIYLFNKKKLFDHFKDLRNTNNDWYNDLFLNGNNIVITNELFIRHYYLIIAYFINSRLNTKYNLPEINIFYKIAEYIQLYRVKDIYIHCAIKHDLILKPKIRFYEINYANDYFKCDYDQYITYPDPVKNENIDDRYYFYNNIHIKKLYCLVNTELNNYLLDDDKFNWNITYQELNKENFHLILFSYNMGTYLGIKGRKKK